MKVPLITRSLYASGAGVGPYYGTVQLTNVRVLSAQIAIYGAFGAASYGYAYLSRHSVVSTANNPFVNNTEGTLALLWAAPVDNTAGTSFTDALFVPLGFEITYPESLTLVVYSSAVAATVSGSVQLHLRQL